MIVQLAYSPLKHLLATKNVTATIGVKTVKYMTAPQVAKGVIAPINFGLLKQALKIPLRVCSPFSLRKLNNFG